MNVIPTARRKLVALRHRMTILNLSDETGCVKVVRSSHAGAGRPVNPQPRDGAGPGRAGPSKVTASRSA